MKKFCFVLAIFFSLPYIAFSADPQISTRSEALTAIDILLEPGDTMLARAKADNARLRENYPEGFALDAAHTPHISILQCYVRTRDLPKIISAVKRVVRVRKPGGMELMATDYDIYSSEQGVGLAVIAIARTPELLEYQKAVIDAARPFMVANGTADAFVPNENGAPIGKATVADIEAYIHHSGDHYRPHVTIGLAHEALLRKMIAAPFTPLTFRIKCAGVYQLGDFGTARKKLWASTVSV
jgi:hypothetical protein